MESLPPIQGLWIGDRLSVMQRLSIASFLAQGHPFHLYVYRPMESVPAGTCVLDAGTVLPASEIFTYRHGPGRGSCAVFANLFRYKLLLEEGGWWVDLDTIALRPFDFAEPYVYGCEGDVVVNGVMKVPAECELARDCYERASAMGKDVNWGETGPRLLTTVIRELDLARFAQPESVFLPIAWRRWEDLIRAGGQIPVASHAVHLYHEMWRRAGRDPDTPCEPTSIYEQLKRRYL